MFREMHRKRQALSLEECAAILNRGTAGVLALFGDDGYPYAVPISYVYDGNKIYFHCAKSGHKLDAIQKMQKHLSVLLIKSKLFLKNTPPILEV